nr:transporter substrate-binding domain-containing protein [uncultured Pseudomonas sp.]
MVATLLRNLMAWSLCLSGEMALAREWLAVGTNFPQVFERSAEGEYRGLAVSVLHHGLDMLGHSVRFELHPWARAQYMVEQGQADILIGPYKTAEREARFAFSTMAFYRDRVVFYGRRDRLPPWHGDYQALPGRPIGVVRAWSYGDRFVQAKSTLDLVTVESVENGLKMLSLGRLQLLASNQRNSRPVLLKLGLLDEIVELDPPISLEDGYFAFPRLASHDALRKDFDRALAEMIEQGELARLAEGWQVQVP